MEAVTEATGRIVGQGDLCGIIRAVRAIESRGKESFREPCRNYALAHFRKEDRYADYLRLYDELLPEPAGDDRPSPARTQETRNK